VDIHELTMLQALDYARYIYYKADKA